MGERITVHLDDPAILRLVTETTDKLASKAADSVQRRARRHAPKRTGKLAASIYTLRIEAGPVTTYSIGSDLHYARYQEFGTGPINARPGGVLAWPSAGGMVFARHTRGVPATHFMRKAGETISERDFA
jgi:HK97 gp10 family phage protein